MKRRSKEDMSKMINDVNYYLIFANNDPHVAYNNYIKDYLLRGKQLPYYIKGLKDFITISKDYERNTLLSFRKNKIVIVDNEQIKNNLINLSKEYWIKIIKPIFKTLDSQNYKSTLINLWYAILTQDIKMLDNMDISNLRDINKNYNLNLF
jgi:hypothetical protein